MKRLVLVMVLCLATPAAFAQPPGGSGGQRPPMTPEQQAVLAAKRQAEMTAPRPIEALDSVWMEDRAEYYDYTSVQKLLQDNGIAEQIKLGASSGSDGIHDEYGIDALMALYDHTSIRIEQRKKANRTTINGVSLLPMEKTLEMGKKIVELRTQLTVDAIHKAMTAAKSARVP